MREFRLDLRLEEGTGFKSLEERTRESPVSRFNFY